MMSFSEIRTLARNGNVVPLHVRIPADLDTPVSAYLKVAANRRHSFLLESIEGGEKLARYSFVGFDPFLLVESSGNGVTLRQGRTRRTLDADPLEFMRELFRQYRPVHVPGLPRFTGGAVGYFAYDTIRWLEDIPDSNPDDLGLPLMRFGLYKSLVAFDHLRQEIVVIGNVMHQPGEKGLRAKYNEARDSINQIVVRLQRGLRPRQSGPVHTGSVKAQYEQKQFESMVRKAKRYIKEGDIFQVVLSQRWSLSSNRTALEVYRRLRRINPSPYMFLVRSGDDALIGASPEMLVRVENGTVETRPIAGTRPRGRDEVEDDKLARELLADPKELAEHTMLLDLGRNDIGRVSKPGSVHVKDKMIIERYSHVLHIVSSVAGKLDRGVAPLEGFLACFPAGTVSGAPKIRAMEIIDELENRRRGPYAGAVAYLDFWGNLDSCISIRTIVKRGKTYHVQAGAGIVADSKPRTEFNETRAKASALMEAVLQKD
ncbi:anthranilate synthase component I [candidate division GN15 bacterium]|nr:anthranilate synthase component I [candidate division GN15 bacterium]